MSISFITEGDHIRMEAFGIELEMLSAIPELIASVGEVGSDPAADRLFPDVYEDEDDDREFRRLAAADIVTARDNDGSTVRGIVEALGDGGDIALSSEEAESLARAIGTARITIAARNGLYSEPELPVEPRTRQELIVAVLAGLQDDLLIELSSGMAS